MDKNIVHTLLGNYNCKTNEFLTVDGISIECLTYRSLLKTISENNEKDLLVVNVRWSEAAQSWIIFQFMFLEV